MSLINTELEKLLVSLISLLKKVSSIINYSCFPSLFYLMDIIKQKNKELLVPQFSLRNASFAFGKLQQENVIKESESLIEESETLIQDSENIMSANHEDEKQLIYFRIMPHKKLSITKEISSVTELSFSSNQSVDTNILKRLMNEVKGIPNPYIIGIGYSVKTKLNDFQLGITGTLNKNMDESSYAHAARREIREEFGQDVQNITHLKLLESYKVYKKTYNCFYVTTDSLKPLDPIKIRKNDASGEMSKEKILIFIVGTKDELMNAVNKTNTVYEPAIAYHVIIRIEDAIALVNERTMNPNSYISVMNIQEC